VPLRIIDVQADHGAVRDHFALILEQPRPRSHVVLTYSRWTPAHRGDSAEAVVSDCDGALLPRYGLWHRHRQIQATQDLLLAVAYVVAFCHVARAHVPCCHAAPRVRWSQGPRGFAERENRGTEREGGTSSCRNPAPHSLQERRHESAIRFIEMFTSRVGTRVPVTVGTRRRLVGPTNTQVSARKRKMLKRSRN
jgi:hypothetical protein